jgi:putative transposase
MAERPGDYRWTSYHANAYGASDVLITHHELYERLGQSGPERQGAYRRLFDAQLSRADVEAIRDATNKNWALGDEHFKKRIEALSGRRSELMRKSRPARTVRTQSRV